MNIGTGILSWLLLVLPALTSAILCIAPASLGGWLGVLYVGPSMDSCSEFLRHLPQYSLR